MRKRYASQLIARAMKDVVLKPNAPVTNERWRQREHILPGKSSSESSEVLRLWLGILGWE